MAVDVVQLTPELRVRLERLGADTARAIADANIASTAVTTEQYFAFWEALGAVSPADIGLRLAAATQVQDYDLVSLAALHSPDVATAFDKTARYKRLCGPKDLMVEHSKDELAMFTVWRYTSQPTPVRLVDGSLASHLILLRRGTGRQLVPKRVELVRARADEAMLARFFGCPVHYGARRNALVFDAATLALPFVTHNEDLLRALLPDLEAQLEPLEHRSFLDEVRAVIARRMSGEKPSVEKVAHELALSARTLQRRLGELGVSYQALLDEVRHTTAVRLLRANRLDVNEIAFLLGFEELNSFTRAFRAWEGMTPLRWRDQPARHPMQRVMD